MRVKINLSAGNDVLLPIEYNYSVYLNLRKTILEYVNTHKPKLFYKYKKSFPGFTFSQLMIPQRQVETGFIKILGNFLSVFVSSEDDAFIEYLVKSINQQKELTIHSHKFPLKKIEILEEPEFEPVMRFRMLSPLLLVTVEDDKPRFIRPTDADLNDVFARHLVENVNRLYKKEFRPADIELQLDQGYMERKHVLTRLITVRGINYKTIFAPIRLKGERELMRFGYRRGLGFKTNFGFGMIEAVEPESM